MPCTQKTLYGNPFKIKPHPHPPPPSTTDKLTKTKQL